MSYNFKKIADLELLNEKPDGASVVIETKGAVKRLQADKVGATSWNDLKDKPFGETTVKGDTLTWDGNTEGRTVVDMGGYPLVHVSDAVVTAKDVSNGYSMEIVPDGVREFPSDFVQEIADNVLLLNDEIFLICCSADNCEVSAIGLVFPKRGVYFMGGEYSIKSLTIPGYNGFETTTIQPIDTKYLPEHLQFGTETKVVEGDTLTWDGNTEGLVSVADMLYKISDNVLTIDDVQNGAIVTTSNKEATTYSADQILEFTNAYGLVCFGGVYSVPSDSFELEGMVFPKAGIYVMAAASAAAYTESITIPGYGKFVSEQTVVTPLAEQYMPTLTSPSGKKFKLSVDDSGVLSATEVTE